jgi:hypothetical protein
VKICCRKDNTYADKSGISSMMTRKALDRNTSMPHCRRLTGLARARGSTSPAAARASSARRALTRATPVRGTRRMVKASRQAMTMAPSPSEGRHEGAVALTFHALQSHGEKHRRLNAQAKAPRRRAAPRRQA